MERKPVLCHMNTGRNAIEPGNLLPGRKKQEFSKSESRRRYCEARLSLFATMPYTLVSANLYL